MSGSAEVVWRWEVVVPRRAVRTEKPQEKAPIYLPAKAPKPGREVFGSKEHV